MTKISRALISVSNKEGIEALAKELQSAGIEILSTGGTAKLLKHSGVQVVEISQYVNSPEILGGRVKSLHPIIHGGILALRDDEQHRRDMEEVGIKPIDMVVVNFYPFEEVIQKQGATISDAVENIDIGGPAMVRAAAKNHRHVTVLTDPADYEAVIKELESSGSVSPEVNFKLAVKAFSYVTRYDAAISNFLGSFECTGGRTKFPASYTLHFQKLMELRYGENPHQEGAYYRRPGYTAPAVSTSEQLQGKALSLNNIYDTDTAFEAVKEFKGPACVIVKHNNPCGVATAQNPCDAFLRAKECDSVSAFGGIVAFNTDVDEDTATELAGIFLEVIVAPGYSEGAIATLSRKKNLRVMKSPPLGERPADGLDIKLVQGGALIQDRDLTSDEDFKTFEVRTKKQPTDEEIEALKFAWKVCKHVKSNAIVLARPGQTVAIGAGQTSRVDSVKLCGMKALMPTEGAALASDAFFPFRDGIDEAAKLGVKAIVQPGGSIRDEDTIAACDEHGIAMVFTGVRHFRH